MEIPGIFFDGKTSKPYQVTCNIVVDELKIIFNSDDISNKDWNLDDCKIESLNASDHVLVSHNFSEGERLEFKEEFAKQILPLVGPEDTIIAQSYNAMLTENPFKVVIGAFAVLGMVAYLYLAHVSPFIADRVVAIIPRVAEVKLGQATMTQITSIYDVNDEKSKIIQEFYEACGFTSEYPIEIKVIDDELVNAFAAPGGQIVVFQGILDKTPSWESLAGLIAHEKAHVENRHSLRILARSASSYLIVSALTGDIAGASGLLLENAYRLNELSNSRDHEREADSEGLTYLRDLNIRPEGMKELFQTLLEEQEIDLGRAMEILSTHPLSEDRIEDIETIISSESSYQYSPVDNSRAQKLWEQLRETSEEKEKAIEDEALEED